MVGKLYKYESYTYLKTLLPINIILFAVAIASRFIQIFDIDFFVYDIIVNSAAFMYFVTLVVCFAAVFVIAIARFYKNLYTAEGYLSFTLPVTATQHILVKFTTAVAFMLLTVVSAVVSFMIFSAGDLFVEIVKVVEYLLKKAYSVIGINTAFYIAEFALLLIVTFCTNLLLYYSCISIGQLFKKNRVLGAVGVYFIYYIITQIIGTIFIIAIVTVEKVGVLEKIAKVIADNYKLFIHIGLFGMAVVYAALAVAFFFINKHIMTKKLNLE